MKDDCQMDERGTRIFLRRTPRETPPEEVIARVHAALEEKGYDAVEQMVGFLLSGDPTYITEHDGARGMVQRVERDILLQSLVAHYIRTRETGEEDQPNELE